MTPDSGGSVLNKVASLTLVAAVALVLAAFGVLDYRHESKLHAAKLCAILEGVPGQLAQSLVLPLRDRGVGQIDRIVESVMKGNEAILAVAVHDARQPGILTGLIRDAQWRPVKGTQPLGGEGLLAAFSEVTYQGARLGGVDVWVTDRFERRAMNRFLRSRLMSILALTGVLAGVIWLLFQRTALPHSKNACLVKDEKAQPLSIFRNNQDMGERQQIEDSQRASRDELAANQEKLSLAMELTGMGAWEFDVATGLFRFDDRFFALFGTSREREGGEYMTPEAYVREFLPPEEAHVVAEGMARGMASPVGTSVQTIEHRIIRRDGQVRDIAVHVKMLWDASGRIVRVVGANQDITERKMAERSLRAANRALRAFKEFSNGLPLAENESSLITDLCRVLVEVCGYRMAWVGMAEQDAAKSVRRAGQWGVEAGILNPMVVTWDDSETGNGTVGMAIKTGQPQVAKNILTDARFAAWRDMVETLQLKACLALPLLHAEHCLGALTIYADQVEVFDPEETELLLKLAEDLTYGIYSLRQREANLRAEEQLRQSEEKFSTLFRLSPNAIILTNAATESIIEVNEAFTRTTGYDASEAIGKSLRESGLIADTSKFRASQELLRKHGHFENLDFEFVRKDGSMGQCISSCKQIRIGENLYNLVVNADVTEAKRLQEVMIRTEKMVSMAGIAAGIAHEINNPLGIIAQSALGVVRRFDPLVPANRREAESLDLDIDAIQTYLQRRNITTYIQATLEASKRAAEIVRNMLNFSRNVSSNMLRVALPDIVRQAIFFAEKDYDLKKKCGFHDIKITVRMEDDLPQFYCQPTDIEQVLLNLLRNAAQAMAEANIATPSITIRGVKAQEGIIVEVEDNGPGIPKEDLDKVFEPFYTTKKIGEGTGLGLSVSYFIIVNKYGGAMTVSCEEGRGACFTIQLPLSSVSASVSPVQQDE